MAHINNKSITALERERLIKAGEKERYCLTQIIEILNCNDQYYFQVFQTESNQEIPYDAVVLQRYKMTDNIVDIYFVEIKIRTKHYDELILQKTKLNAIRSEITKWKKKFGPLIEPKILYISFTPKGTYLHFIDTLIENGLMPKLTKDMSMNDMTVAENVKKVNKQVYLLPIELAIYKKYKFNLIEYDIYLTEEIKRLLKESQEVKKEIIKTYSIF